MKRFILISGPNLLLKYCLNLQFSTNICASLQQNPPEDAQTLVSLTLRGLGHCFPVTAASATKSVGRQYFNV